jgi:group I intron endonuclease
MVGIYKIVNPKGIVYIGQSWDIDKREKYYAKERCKNQTKLYNSIVKYGWDNHQFCKICILPHDISQKVLDTYEILYWSMYKNSNIKMLNIREPGSRGRHSEATRSKMSSTKKEAFKKTPEKFKNFKNANIGRKLSQEQIGELKIKLSGSNNPNYGKCGDKHWNYGKASPKKGLKTSPEIIQKLKQSAKHLKKPLALYDLNDVFIRNFDSIRDATKFLELSEGHIRQYLRGKTTRVKNWKFKLL